MDETLKKQLEITACKVRLGILEEYSTQSRVIRADRSLSQICSLIFILPR